MNLLSVWITHHVTQVQDVESKEGHIFLVSSP